MTVLPILEFPDPILRRRARLVGKMDLRTENLIGDMIDTVRYAKGVGLAANQIGVLRRIIVLQMPYESDPKVYINPRILYRHGKRDVLEGCLSVPGYSAIITRSIWVKAAGLDGNTRIVRLHANGLFAQALEHEIDHLNGILYIDHLKSHQELIGEHHLPEKDSPDVTDLPLHDSP